MSETTTTETRHAIPISVQGWPLVAIARDAVYYRLPKELQQPTGGCSCRYCLAHPDEVPSWDTLGIPITTSGAALTWTVHAPEWTPATPYRFKDK